MYHHILIPTDGSDTAAKGVQHGLTLARALGARVTVVTATDSPPAYFGFDGYVPQQIEGFSEIQQSAAAAALDAARAQADAAGVPVEVRHVADSATADAIIDTADQVGADLIVMSSHGRRGVRQLVLGSQTSEVIARSPIPVLVVR